MKKLGIISCIIYFILALSLSTYLAEFVPPSSIWIFGVLPLMAPMVILLNMVALSMSAFSRNRILTILSSILMLYGLTRISRHYNLYSSNIESRSHLRVLSFNVSFFHNKGDFSKEYYSEVLNTKAIDIRSWIGSVSADIMCLQEFYNDYNSDIFNNIDYISKGYPYHFFLANPRHENKRSRGLMIFSKYPIIEQSKVFVDDNNFNGAQLASVVIKKDTIRIINTHLHSMRLFSSSKSGGFSFDRLKSTLNAFKNGLIIREKQTDQLMTAIQSSNLPTILAGDLNEMAGGYVYSQLRSELNNSFEQAGIGFGRTLNNNYWPFLRIDNQFYSREFDVLNHKTYTELDLTNHFPVLVEYKLRQE